MSMDSDDYKLFKYTVDTGSVNHPSFDKESLSSFDSKSDGPISRVLARVSPSYASSKKMSCKSEPMPLTEQTLALHNSMIPQIEKPILVKEEEELLNQSLLDKVNERCNDIQQDFEEKIKQLEAQFAKAELDYHQSRTELQQLDSMEKEYINQGIQTELNQKDVDFIEQAKKIIWDTPFIPINAICRQLPTLEEGDTCDYHRDKIETYKKEKKLYDTEATLERLSHWSNTIKYNF